MNFSPFISGIKESLRNRSDTGSGFIIDMERERSHTLDSMSEQNFFQRALLRVSNRFRKHNRARAATVGSQKQVRQKERSQLLNQASSSKENGSTGEAEGGGTQAVFKKDIVELPSDLNKKSSITAFKGRSNSHGDFGTEYKARGKRELVQRTATPLRTNNDNVTVGDKQVNATQGRLISSVGSASMVSTRSRGLSSTTSDVFTDDINDNECKTKQNGPPVAPPRSPASLGIFTFPDMPDGKDEGGDSEYLNREGIDKLTRRATASSPADGNEVIFRRRAEDFSLLDEIDREIKRRTREEDVPSTPLSHTSVDGPNSFDFYDQEEDGNYVMLKTTDTGPTVDMSIVDNQVHSRKQSSDVCRKQSAEASLAMGMLGNERSAAIGNHKPERIAEKEFNYDPGVHSPDRIKVLKEEAAYQNIAEVMMEGGENAATKGRRNSSRRSSSKHLSDPLLMERLRNIQQLHNGTVASSLRELSQETNYVNCQGRSDSGEKSSFYVNVNVGEAMARNNRKKKPSPLNINFEKYDDDDNIYHIVGSLANDRSGSSDGLGSYRNIGGGPFANDTGRITSRDRAYVNVPSQKGVPMLNYVLVSGSKGSSSHMYRGERSDSLNSVHSDKSDKVPYSYIDEKATSLLQRTREQHWQRRAEDGQAKLNTPKKSKKSFGD